MSPIHRTGGFARVNLRRGKRLIEYVGPKLSKAEGQTERDDHNVCILTLDEDDEIDGSVAWNPARFLNPSCKPNGEVAMERECIELDARRRLPAGEKRTDNSGGGLGGFEDRPCHCGASTGVGFMVDEPYVATVRHCRAKW